MKSALLAIAVVLSLAACHASAAEEPHFFTVERDETGVWWFRNPQGEQMLSLGVSDIPAGPTAEQYDASKPGYAAFRYYKSTDDWVQSVRDNLRQWGFNTIGAWAHPQLRTNDLPECRVLHWGLSLHVPWNDIFAEDFAKQIDELAQRDVKPASQEQNLIGWFTDNELQWYADTMFYFHLHTQQDSATRDKLLALLKEFYDDDFAALQADFSVGEATNFEQLGRHGQVHFKPGGKGFAVVDQFASAFATEYYKVLHDAIRRYDRNHLILGDRYMSYCPPVVAKAAGPYVDVISSNFDWPDWKTGQFPTHYLQMLHEQSGKPVLITEWYVAAEENRSGNRNTGVSFTIVKTQDQRALTAERRLQALVNQPYVVGAHWFRYADEPTHGRASDGEDFNFGLVDIENQPYEKLVEGMQRAHSSAIATHRNSALPDTGKPLTINHYPTEMSFPDCVEQFSAVAADTLSPLADLQIAWDRDQLYLGLVGFRFVDQQLFKDDKIPESHHQRLSLKIGEDTFELTFDPNRASAGQQLHLSMIESQHRHLGVRFTYLIAVPAKLTKSLAGLSKGTVVPLEVELHDPVGPSTRWQESLVLREPAERLAETIPVVAPSRGLAESQSQQ